MSSFASSKIGQCSICWSFLTSSNTFAITKCGHRFHQNCINQWMKNAKRCPSCRTSASESDVIKLFIQEYVIDDTAVAEPQNDINKKEYIDIGHYVMSKCKCEIVQNDNGDLQYKCTNGVNINCEKTSGVIKVILPGGYNGQRIEYFNEGYKYKYGVVNIDIRKVKEEPITFRSNNDHATNYGDYIKYFCPGFTVKRSLKNGNSGEFIVKVFSTTDSNKFLLIQACPRHHLFLVKHYDGNDQYCCIRSFQKFCPLVFRLAIVTGESKKSEILHGGSHGSWSKGGISVFGVSGIFMEF